MSSEKLNSNNKHFVTKVGEAWERGYIKTNAVKLCLVEHTLQNKTETFLLGNMTVLTSKWWYIPQHKCNDDLCPVSQKAKITSSSDLFQASQEELPLGPEPLASLPCQHRLLLISL